MILRIIFFLSIPSIFLMTHAEEVKKKFNIKYSQNILLSEQTEYYFQDFLFTLYKIDENIAPSITTKNGKYKFKIINSKTREPVFITTDVFRYAAKYYRIIFWDQPFIPENIKIEKNHFQIYLLSEEKILNEIKKTEESKNAKYKEFALSVATKYLTKKFMGMKIKGNAIVLEKTIQENDRPEILTFHFGVESQNNSKITLKIDSALQKILGSSEININKSRNK